MLLMLPEFISAVWHRCAYGDGVQLQQVHLAKLDLKGLISHGDVHNFMTGTSYWVSGACNTAALQLHMCGHKHISS